MIIRWFIDDDDDDSDEDEDNISIMFNVHVIIA